jgi:hypothetical protein
VFFALHEKYFKKCLQKFKLSRYTVSNRQGTNVGPADFNENTGLQNDFDDHHPSTSSDCATARLVLVRIFADAWWLISAILVLLPSKDNARLTA